MDVPTKTLLVAALLLAPALAACTPETPETQLSWGVNDRIQVSAHVASNAPAPKSAKASAKTYVYQDGGDKTPAPRARPQQQAYKAPVSYRPEPRDNSNVAFGWPLSGAVISSFGATTGGERNDGINIATARGEEIHASAAGTVTYAGNELKDYGNLLLIKHAGGYVTAYAHADKLLVGRGDNVAKGQVIGYAGTTGDVASPQLHFEIRRDTTPLNPKTLLVARNS